MSQLIKELAEQAGFIPDAFLEKFAELIVLECAEIARKAEYSDTWLEPVEDTIKKHFGVEQ